MERELVKLHRVTAKGLPAPASGLAESGEMLDAHREVAFWPCRCRNSIQTRVGKGHARGEL